MRPIVLGIDIAIVTIAAIVVTELTIVDVTTVVALVTKGTVLNELT